MTVYFMEEIRKDDKLTASNLRFTQPNGLQFRFGRVVGHFVEGRYYGDNAGCSVAQAVAALDPRSPLNGGRNDQRRRYR
jgi:hypothetical protein